MQRNNVIVFVILSAMVFAVWYWLAPPAPTKKAEKDEKKLVQADKTQKDKDKKDQVNKKDDKEKKIDKKTEPDKKPPVKAQPKVELATTETLGGDGFHLTVDITTRGAGLRRVALNRFKAANWRGEPTEQVLDLIQDDEYAPSFRMYHYLDPADKNPIFGLGEKIWTFDGKETKKDEEGNVLYHEARYSTRVPDLDHVKIVKVYRLAPKDYHIALLLELHDTRPKGGEPTIFRYQLTGAQGLPIEGEWYAATFRNAISALVDPDNNVYRKLEDSMRINGRRGGDTWPDNKYSRGNSRLQYAGIANQYFGVMTVVDDKQPDRKDGGTTPDNVVAWSRPTLATNEKIGVLVKVLNDKNLLLFSDEEQKVHPYVLLPRTKTHLEDLEIKEGQKFALSFYETPDGTRVAAWARLGTTLKPQFDDITMRINSEKLEIPAGGKVAHQFLLYHGPVKAALLAQFTGDKEVPDELVSRYTDTLHLVTMTDYHSDNWFSKEILARFGVTKLIIWFTRLMHWLLNLLHYVFGYGLSIVVLTVMVRAAMFPISRKQAMFSIKMQELAPELKKMQEKFPDDPQERMRVQQEFYRKHGINPLGSCWPIFLQMPIFLGLYFALQESIHFRLADFLWIKNLAAPDMLVYWTESIPIISSPDHGSGILGALYLGPYWNILPMFAVVFMMVQQSQTMPPPTDDQQAMQQKMLKYMTIFFGIMFYKVAAGLCIYFISSSLWGMAERRLLPKKKTPPGEPSTAVAGTSNGKVTGVGTLSAKDKGKWGKKEKEKEKTPVTAFEKLKALWKDILRAAEKK